MDEIIKVFRSLAISKNGTISVPELIKDFKDNEGYYVNPNSFGFTDIKEFLIASKQFTFRNCGKTSLISVKQSEASAHVSKLVGLSKRPKGGRVKRKPMNQTVNFLGFN